MSTRPRTPVDFPRMRVRGSRNKKKLHTRLQKTFIIPAGTIVDQGGGRYTLAAGFPAVGVTTHRVEITEWRDGFGRRVRAPKPRPEPPMLRSGSFRLGLTFNNLDRKIFDLLTGKAESAPTCRECAETKHGACDGTALVDTGDDIETHECACATSGHTKTTEKP